MKTSSSRPHENAVGYGLIGFGGIAEHRIAAEGFACDRERCEPRIIDTMFLKTIKRSEGSPSKETL